jgi:trans-feruloyl-CoA hydratase/vanillin synthase
VKVEVEDGIAWVVLNRPEKRNAMTPALHYEMVEILTELEFDPRVMVLVLTGAGDAWSAGQDLKEFFRDLEDNPAERARAHDANQRWRWEKLYYYAKPTIAMVNGHCFGGAFTQLVACDFAIAAEEASFGLSEVNWGTIPGGFVCKAVTEAMCLRDAVWFAVTGESFDGKTAERVRLVNKAVPRSRLREETLALAARLMALDPEAVRATKQAIKSVRHLSLDLVTDYLTAKGAELRFANAGGRERAMAQFLDNKSFRPGFGPSPKSTGPK